VQPAAPVEMTLLDRLLSLAMRYWTSWEPSTAGTPRPTDAPRGHAPGHDPDRILLLGSGPAAGWGVASHEVALPGTLAREVAAHTRRGADVELVSRVDMTARDAEHDLVGRDLATYDAIVVVLGVNDALRLTSPRAWRASMSQLLSTLLESASGDAGIVVVGIQPITSIPAFRTRRGTIAGRHGVRLNSETQAICERDPRITFVPLPPQSPSPPGEDRHRSTQQYQEWARIIAEPIAPQLAARDRGDQGQLVSVGRSRRSEKERQDAVDGMALPENRSHAQLQQIAALARKAFNSEFALITVLDHDRQRHLAGAGQVLPDIPRSSSFCEFAIDSPEAMVVRDTRQDQRFKNNSLVTGDPHIRFYAGFPIESRSGHRIGTLCIVDTRPRSPSDDVDVVFLRELAHLAQRELAEFG